jgi:hypothetical protein
MRISIAVAGLAAMLALGSAASAGVVVDFCTLAVCNNGEVFCTPGAGDAETIDDPKQKVVCKLTVLETACSEVPECGRRVPTMSFVGVFSLGAAMIAAGVALLRLRRRNP